MQKVNVRVLRELSSGDYRLRLEKAFGRELCRRDFPTIEEIRAWQEKQVTWI